MKFKIFLTLVWIMFFCFTFRVEVNAVEVCGYASCFSRFDCFPGDTCVGNECCYDCVETCSTACGQSNGCGGSCPSGDVGDYWCGSCSTNCGSNSRTCYYTCGGSFTQSCACIECEDCSPRCGQSTDCNGTCSNVDNGLPTAPSILSPDGTSANPTLVSNPAVQLSWSSNSGLTDYYQAEVLNSSDSVVWSSGNVAGLSATTSVLSSGVYHWHVRAVNTTCGTDTGSYSIYGYFRINSPPTLNNSPPGNYLVLQNSAAVTVLPEAGNRNHICQSTFVTAPATPRQIRLLVTATDADGGSDITGVSVRLSPSVTVTSAGTVAGDWSLVSGVTSSVNGNNRTYTFHMNLGNLLDSSTLYNLEAIATDSWNANSGWVDSTRDFKVWNCQVPVSGMLYDGSAGQACPANGFSVVADDSMGFSSLIFDGTSTADVPASVSLPANFGSNNLVWGYSYLPLFNGGTVINFDGDLAASGRTTRLIDLGTGTTVCPSSSFNTGTLISAYSANPSAQIDFSFIRDQLGWFQVGGGGVKGRLGISSGVPVTAPLASRAMSVAIARAGNGLISSPSLSNINGFNDDSAYGIPDNWWINRNTNDSSSHSYQSFYNTFYINGGVGTTGTNWAGRQPTGIYFVNGNLNIDTNHILNPGEYFMVVASGIITINSAVTRLDGIYVADGGISASGSSANQLVINGILYSRDDIRLAKSYTDGTLNNTDPAVRVNYDPNLIFNMPGRLMRVLNGWREE